MTTKLQPQQGHRHLRKTTINHLIRTNNIENEDQWPYNDQILSLQA